MEQNIKSILKESGLKYTKQRELVYDIFLNNPMRHMTTEEVYNEVLKEMPEIGIATVYRTVQVLEELGLITPLTFKDGITHYELKKDDGHDHHHLVCIQCQKIIGLKKDLLDHVEEMVEEQEDFTITNHNLTFYGLCNVCRKEQGENNNEKQ